MCDPPVGEMPVFRQLLLSSGKLKEKLVVCLPVLKKKMSILEHQGILTS